jgi:hypothetical protein
MRGKRRCGSLFQQMRDHRVLNINFQGGSQQDGKLAALLVVSFLYINDWLVVLPSPMVNSELELRIGGQHAVRKGFAGERTGRVAAIQPFDNGFAFVIQAIAVHEWVVHDFQR